MCTHQARIQDFLGVGEGGFVKLACEMLTNPATALVPTNSGILRHAAAVALGVLLISKGVV